MRLPEALFVTLAAPAYACLYNKCSQLLFCEDMSPDVLGRCDKGLRQIYRIDGAPRFCPFVKALFNVEDALSEKWGVVLRKKKGSHPKPNYDPYAPREFDWSEEDVLTQLGEQIIYDANKAAEVVYETHFKKITSDLKELE